jgi:hypothetical protein
MTVWLRVAAKRGADGHRAAARDKLSYSTLDAAAFARALAHRETILADLVIS